MLFWDVIRGSVQFKNGNFIAITDAEGKFVLSQHIVPEWSAGTEWQIPVIANDPTLLRVKFEPNDFRDFSLTTDVLQRVTVGTLPSEKATTRLEIVARSQTPFSEITFNNWLPTTSSVSFLLYQLTSTAFGDNVWKSSSLIVKPYFFSTADISARYDFSGYNNGVVHF